MLTAFTKQFLRTPKPKLQPLPASLLCHRVMSSHEKLAISLRDIEEAHGRIRDHVHYTPVMECTHLNSLSGHKLYFKCEQFQRTGAFKIRGAINALSKLCSPVKEGEDKPIIVTHSSGNHAMAIALAANVCGIEAHVVMPRTSPENKVAAVRGYGGEVHFCEPTEEARGAAADALIRKYAPRAVTVHSANDPDVMAGQGTIGLEFLEQVPDLDVLIASVSCGGLLSGICVAAKGKKPDITIVGAEPENADDFAKSFAAGRIIPNNPSYPETIADGLRMSVASLTFPVLKTHVSGVITTSEQEIIDAMKLVWERMKVVIEPSAACTVAAVLKKDFSRLVGTNAKKVGVVLCGGNTDLNRIPWMK